MDEPATFKTKVQAFINGTSVYDPLIGTPSVGETRGSFYFPAGDPFGAGAKIDDGTSYISYRLGSPLTEGEVSFNATRIKTGDLSFDNQYRVITMQDGTGNIATNAWRVSADKRSPADGGRGRLEFFVNGVYSGRVESGPQSWDERKTYFLRLEWRAGTVRFRIYDGNTDGAPLKIDLSTSYSGTYSPPNHVINIGTRNGETMRDMRVSNVWISAQPRRFPSEAPSTARHARGSVGTHRTPDDQDAPGVGASCGSLAALRWRGTGRPGAPRE